MPQHIVRKIVLKLKEDKHMLRKMFSKGTNAKNSKVECVCQLKKEPGKDCYIQMVQFSLISNNKNCLNTKIKYQHILLMIIYICYRHCVWLHRTKIVEWNRQRLPYAEPCQGPAELHVNVQCPGIIIYTVQLCASVDIVFMTYQL